MSEVKVKHIVFRSKKTGTVYGAYGIDECPDWGELIEKE